MLFEFNGRFTMGAAEECSRSGQMKMVLQHVRLRLDRKTTLIKVFQSHARLKLSWDLQSCAVMVLEWTGNASFAGAA